MDPLPPHPPTNTAPTAYVASTTIATQPGYPESNDFSPRSRQTDTSNESQAQVPGAKLRVMCSYGGHIIPRPHDKSLCYVNGETRMVVIDRHSSLSSLSTRLSQSLLNGRHFTLKYQLPNEELDSLISVTTDEDLENMVEEYDRILSNSPLKPSRLRLFLFLAKPETAASMGSLLTDAKSETWFVDALNGTGLLPRGLSDSAVTDCLLELNDRAVQVDIESQTDLQESNNDNNNKNLKCIQELQSTMPDSPLVETGSSFGSSSSSPSMSNLPPIKVRADDTGARFQNQMAGLDEQFSNIGINNESDLLSGALPILPPVVATVVQNDERLSDQEVVPMGFRKPPLPLQLVQRKIADGYKLPSPDSKNAGGFNLHSPDSVASDSSIGSGISLPKHAGHQETITQIPTGEQRLSLAPAISPAPIIQDPNSQVQVQQIHEHPYPPMPQQIQLQQQQQQQQYAHPGIQYIQAPMSSYYPVYPPAPQQQAHHQLDQHHYPMYVLPMGQTNQTQVPQPFTYPVQANNIAESTVVASSAGPIQNNIMPAQPIYRTANHFQQQYLPIQGNNLAHGVTYGYEYSQPTNEHVYYTQVGQLPPQHQTMTAATAVMLAQASAQMPGENSTQQIRPSQPL